MLLYRLLYVIIEAFMCYYTCFICYTGFYMLLYIFYMLYRLLYFIIHILTYYYTCFYMLLYMFTKEAKVTIDMLGVAISKLCFDAGDTNLITD